MENNRPARIPARKPILDGSDTIDLVDLFGFYLSRLPLLIAAFAVAFSLNIVVWAVVVSLWAVVISLAAGVVWCLIQVFVYQRAGNLAGALFAGGAALVCAGLAIALFFACRALTKGVILLTKRIVLWIKSKIVGREAAA